MNILKQPLVHFLLLGLFLFIAYSWFGNDSDFDFASQEIVITPGRIETLAENFKKVWQRDPSDSELEGLIEEFIREEIYYREALAIGLDRDDTIIRRRLQQKMEFITDDLSDQLIPDEADLQEFLNKNLDVYIRESKFTFQQVYLDPSKRIGTIEQDTNALLLKLNGLSDPIGNEMLGDRIMLDYRYNSVSESEIRRLFGQEFSTSLASLKTGKWMGPVNSGYGIHLVYIAEKTESTVPELADVKEAVMRDWQSTNRRETNEKFFIALRQRYTVTIEQ